MNKRRSSALNSSASETQVTDLATGKTLKPSVENDQSASLTTDASAGTDATPEHETEHKCEHAPEPEGEGEGEPGPKPDRKQMRRPNFSMPSMKNLHDAVKPNSDSDGVGDQAAAEAKMEVTREADETSVVGETEVTCA